MGKRKTGNSEEHIDYKIRKLESELLKAREEKVNSRRRRFIIYSSDSSDEDENSNNRSEDLPPASQARASSQLPERAQNTTASPPRPPPSPVPPPPRASLPPSPRVHSSPPSPRGLSPLPGTSNQATSADKEIPAEEMELDGDILQLLGDAPKSDTPLGPPIHKDVASRWQEILAKGLPKELKEKIFEDYLVPSNCDLLTTPILNPEAKVALSDPLVKRDTFLMQKQKQLGVALSALSLATTMILANETSKQKLLKPISDACRILCDNHFMETKSRRNLVISSSNMQHKDTLLESARDKSWLFGENISEKLRAAKSIQKSGDVLKSQPKLPTKPHYLGKNNRVLLNFKAQHRKSDNKPALNTDSGRGRQQSRAQPRSFHRSNRRSPPPPPRRMPNK